MNCMVKDLNFQWGCFAHPCCARSLRTPGQLPPPLSLCYTTAQQCSWKQNIVMRGSVSVREHISGTRPTRQVFAKFSANNMLLLTLITYCDGIAIYYILPVELIAHNGRNAWCEKSVESEWLSGGSTDLTRRLFEMTYQGHQHHRSLIATHWRRQGGGQAPQWPGQKKIFWNRGTFMPPSR